MRHSAFILPQFWIVDAELPVRFTLRFKSELNCPGAWVIDVAKEFPGTKVIGIDLSAVRKDVIRPPNCEFVTGDMLRVLTTEFKEAQFDYVHSR